jgi:Flp pilus assembly protein TadB
MTANTQQDKPANRTGRRHRITIGSRSFELPASRLFRMSAGVLLIVGGVLGFLPILGFWMVPLGLFILSLDLHWARRLRRRFMVWLTRRYPGIGEKLNGMSRSDLPDDGESR